MTQINKNGKITVVAVAGPTASGKSALAEGIALALGGGVVSCDSMQIYRGMDIGTAKPTSEDMARVEYRMIDVADPTEEFSCADYTAMASREIEQLALAGKLPIVCGGTGLYMDNLLYRTEFSPSGGDEDYRRSLDCYDNLTLHAMLEEVDGESAAAIHPNNRKRVVRALEIYHLTGKTKSYFDSISRVRSSPYNVVKINLVSSDREALYNRINKRVDLMLESGLVDEARGLDLSRYPTAGQAIAYKELSEYLRGEKTLSEAAESLKQATRNYAKRQLTWFARDKQCLCLDISRLTGDELLHAALSYINESMAEAPDLDGSAE